MSRVQHLTQHCGYFWDSFDKQSLDWYWQNKQYRKNMQLNAT